MNLSRSDGTSPGHKWVRTEFGWKTTTERSLLHMAKQMRRLSGELISSSSGSLSSDSNDSKILSKTDRVKALHHALTMRCVPAGGTSSKESNIYSTISDAVHKLNLQLALKDKNCLPFICQVLCLIFDSTYDSSSGSLQMALLRLVESAVTQSVNSRMFNSLVMKAIDKGISANERVRQNQLSTLSLRNFDNKIKALLRMKSKLQDSERRLPGEDSGILLHQLPDDCLRHIISFLSNPRDILNLQQTCLRLNEVSTDNQIWKSLTYFHYGKDINEVIIDEVSWMVTFSAHYSKSNKKLSEDTSNAIAHCKICNYIFWTDYGHPCCGDSAAASALADSTSVELLTPQDFIKHFSY